MANRLLQTESDSKITPVKKQKLAELTNRFGAQIVSDAIRRAALNDSSNLNYIEQCSETLVQEYRRHESDAAKRTTNQIRVPIFKI